MLKALIGFLLKGASRSSSHFKVHNEGTREVSYQWSIDVETSFQKWKECMEILPTVTAPAKGEMLFLHLAEPFNDVSTILLAERRKVQVPIYFARRTLQGAEWRYTKSEKFTLALIHAARLLRRYFKEHPIRVLTDKPIEWELLKPNRSRRMTKWARELEEYDVEYEIHNFAEGAAHASLESDKPSMSSNIEALRVEGERKPHFGD